VWQKRENLINAVTQGHFMGLPIAVFSLFLYFLGQVGEIRTLESSSMILFLMGTVMYLFGIQVLRLTLFPLFFLVLMIPVPAQILASFTIPLQLIVTKITALIVSLIGFPILIEGNIIHMPNKTFEVVHACSGLRSIMSLVTLGAFMGYFMLKNNWQRVLLVLSAVPVAVFVNVIRVFILVFFSFVYGIDLLHGTPHTVLGLVVFLISLCLFFLMQKGLSRWSK
jgi:exosortase